MTNKTLKEKLETIIELANECLVEIGESAKSATPMTKSKSGKKVVEDTELPLKIANKIGDCDEADAIQTNVLDKRDRGARALLCLYVSYKYFDNAWLTTGDIQQITSELGVKVEISNANKAIKSLRAYVETGAVRKKGQATPLRLNRAGVKYFEEIIHTRPV